MEIAILAAIVVATVFILLTRSRRRTGSGRPGGGDTGGPIKSDERD